MSFLPAELIKAKKAGQSHSKAELDFLVRGYASGEIPDYQMAAWLMAVCWRGMSAQETADFTDSMRLSGKTLDFSRLPIRAVDKHSTGGVGDKTSLLLAPIVASLGVPVPMMAGRGLGHTGGTLDKLESIPGFNVRLPLAEFAETIRQRGMAIVGQTKEICPADLKIYSLRDVTGTVDSIPLICASIMSKKLAEGVGGLVLDVKFGSGAFMKSLAAAEELAQGLMRIGQLSRLRMSALLTNMNQPLGRWVGNACELEECLALLRQDTGANEAYSDTLELTLALAGHMLWLAGVCASATAGRDMAEAQIRGGHALERFWQMVRDQGGDPKWRYVPAKQEFVVRASTNGFVSSMNTEKLGIAAIVLGAGRARSEDRIDHSAGMEMIKKLGAPVIPGDPLVRLFGAKAESFSKAAALVQEAIQIGETAPRAEALIAKVLGDGHP